MTTAVPFPSSRPAGFERIGEEPTFDPDRHLRLEAPTDVVTLDDLGYTADEIAGKATRLAASSPFRVLSDEGAAVLLDVARRLREFTAPAADRIERVVRGGCYRSTWLRDLCTSPELTSHLASIYGTAIAPHPMPHHLGHLNYEPTSIDASIDKWHHDTLPLDIVVTVTDPALVDGGRFEYFVGTRREAAELAAEGRTPDPSRVVTPEFPGPGSAIALHGDMVVHRAGPLRRLSERISLVNGYVALDTSLDDQSRTGDLKGVDDPGALWTEWARFAAWRSQGRLQTLIDELAFTADRDAVVDELEFAIDDVRRAIADMRSEPGPVEHYGG